MRLGKKNMYPTLLDQAWLLPLQALQLNATRQKPVSWGCNPFFFISLRFSCQSPVFCNAKCLRVWYSHEHGGRSCSDREVSTHGTCCSSRLQKICYPGQQCSWPPLSFFSHVFFSYLSCSPLSRVLFLVASPLLSYPLVSNILYRCLFSACAGKPDKPNNHNNPHQSPGNSSSNANTQQLHHNRAGNIQLSSRAQQIRYFVVIVKSMMNISNKIPLPLITQNHLITP